MATNVSYDYYSDYDENYTDVSFDFIPSLLITHQPILKTYFFWINIIFLFPTIFGNLLILIALARYRLLRKVKAYMLIGNLAVSDLLVGLIAMPMDIIYLTHEEYSKLVIFCTVHLSFMYTLMGLSVVNLFLLSLERFDAIVYPLLHERRFTRSRIYACIAATWVVMIVFGFLPLYIMHDADDSSFECRLRNVFPVAYRKIFHSIVLGCLFLCAIFFMCIVRIARRTITHTRYAEVAMDNRRMAKDLRHTRNMLFITGMFIVFWAPYCIVSIFPEHTLAMHMVKQALSSFGVINSCLNWIVYGVRIRRFREAFKSILTCNCAKGEYKLARHST